MTLAPVPHLAADALATEIAASLDAVVPPKYALRAQGSDIVLLRDGHPIGVSHAAEIVESVAAAYVPDQHAETAIRAALRKVQEHLSEALGQPWPAADGPTPPPGTRRTGDSVELWFGNEEHPILQPEPVNLLAAARERPE